MFFLPEPSEEERARFKMTYQQKMLEFWSFMQSLNAEQLETMRDLMQQILHNKKMAPYVQGICVAYLSQKGICFCEGYPGHPESKHTEVLGEEFNGTAESVSPEPARDEKYETDWLNEEGRRLANERDNLIASGANPADLGYPVGVNDPSDSADWTDTTDNYNANMDEYGLELNPNGPTAFRCKYCGIGSIGLTDRMLKPPGLSGCSGCQQASKGGNWLVVPPQEWQMK